MLLVPKVNLKYLLILSVWVFVVVGTVYVFNFIVIYDPSVYVGGDRGARTSLIRDYLTSGQYNQLVDVANEMELDVDPMRERDFNEIVRDIETRVPFLPLDFWARQTLIGRKKMKPQCGKFPSIFELEINNDLWQTQRTSNGTYQLFGAYMDNRKSNANDQWYIRILGMIDRVDTHLPMFCQIWYDQQEKPVIVPLEEYHYIWIKSWGNAFDGQYQPYLLSCPIPWDHRHLVPVSVSLVEQQCATATNNLKVLYNRPLDNEKKMFAVCVKGLDFLYQDLSVRLIEWIELLGILGADKIYFYDLQIHPNMSKVLQYYRKLNKVEVTKLTLPAGKPNIPGLQHLFLTQKLYQKRQNEIIPYNDCLYKNMYKYQYITLLDIDEVIMPKGDILNWRELMEMISAKADHGSPLPFPSYNFRNVYFLDSHYHLDRTSPESRDIPEFLHMLQHTNRAAVYSAPNEHVKCIHRANRILTLHNHFAMSCLQGSCAAYEIDVEDAQLQHYRYDCVTTVQRKCHNMTEFYVSDKNIYKFKDDLIKRSLKTLYQLGFLKIRNDSTVSP
uniref:Glycosyltransferase family 92 protein n=1 Tax=Lutzomyia longipalpis TaxID=7200 RepID=A0A7G3AL54_LUTLO